MKNKTVVIVTTLTYEINNATHCKAKPSESKPILRFLQTNNNNTWNWNLLEKNMSFPLSQCSCSYEAVKNSGRSSYYPLKNFK